MRILTLTGSFPDPAVQAAAQAVGLRRVEDTTGQTGLREDLEFEAEDGSYGHYLFEPEVKLPVVLLEGPSAAALRDALARRLPHTTEAAAAAAYDLSGNDDAKIAILRLLSAHALEAVTQPMLRAVGLAARDRSPRVRLGAVQVLQYAHEQATADVVREALRDDPDAEVQRRALDALSAFDSAPDPRSNDGSG